MPLNAGHRHEEEGADYVADANGGALVTAAPRFHSK